MAEKRLPASVQEFELLKATFKGNKDLLAQIRTLLLGFEISPAYKEIIRTTFKDPLLFKAFRKKIFTIYEEDTAESPLEVLSDIWSNSKEMVLGKDQNTIRQELHMRQLTVDMLKKGIELLKNPDGEKINTVYNPHNVDDPWGIQLLARNYYIGSIQQGISNLSIMIEADNGTPSQIAKKLKKDSTE